MDDDILTNLDPDQLMALPSPAIMWREGQPSEESMYRIAACFYRRWIDLLAGNFGYDEKLVEVSYKCARCAEDHKCSRERAMQRLLMIVGCFYGFCAHNLVSSSPAGDGLDSLGIPGCSAQELKELRSGHGSTCIEWSRGLLSHYIGALRAGRALYLCRRTDLQLDMFNDSFERILADSMLGIFHVMEKSVTPEGVCKYGIDAMSLMRRLNGYSLHIQTSVFRWPVRPWSDSHASGPFSLLKLPELQLLAAQDISMQGRYGSKRVESIFELQLAMLMQSFGFYVVKTRTGERTVDLVCVSGDPTVSFTLMIEAKTSKTPYTLPVKDERALAEYISTIKDGLTTMPRLGLVLVVGSAASKSLGARLRRIEASSGVPVRFCRAQELATLRESILGPLPLSVFRKELLDAPSVVSGKCIDAIVSSVNARAAAHEALVRTFLDH